MRLRCRSRPEEDCEEKTLTATARRINLLYMSRFSHSFIRKMKDRRSERICDLCVRGKSGQEEGHKQSRRYNASNKESREGILIGPTHAFSGLKRLCSPIEMNERSISLYRKPVFRALIDLSIQSQKGKVFLYWAEALLFTPKSGIQSNMNGRSSKKIGLMHIFRGEMRGTVQANDGSDVFYWKKKKRSRQKGGIV